MIKPFRAALAIVFLIAGLIVATYLIPPFFVSDRSSLQVGTRWQAIAAARTAFVQLLGGIALLCGLYFTARTYWLARVSQRNDRFAGAVDNLGKHDSGAAQAGGAYILYLLAQEDPGYWPIVEEVLVHVVRNGATDAAAGTARSHEAVQAALTVLGRRPNRPSGSKGRPLNLAGLNLNGYDVGGGANLDRAALQGSQLRGTKLSGASLIGASLDNAVLDGADLSGADLREATLMGAVFHDANMYRANLADAVIDDVAQFAGARNLQQMQIDHTRQRDPTP